MGVWETLEKVPVHDATIAVARAGSGPPLFFLHGWDASHAYWTRLLPLLASRYTCIAWDQRGWGASTGEPEPPYDLLAADVAAVIAHLDLPHPLLVSHSWGAKVALA